MPNYSATLVIVLSCVLCGFPGECFEKMIFSSHPWNMTALNPPGQPVVRTINGSPYDLRANQSLYNDASAITTTDRWAKYFALAVDYERGLTYIHEYVSSVIFVTDSDNFTDFRSFHIGVSGSRFNRIAVDWISDVVYWTDVLNQWVCMQPGYSRNPEGTQFKVLYTGMSVIPHGLAIDPIKGYLFWSDVGTSKKIVRMNLAGAELQDIITTSLGAPISLAADLATSRLYWIDLEEETIEHATYEGEDRTVLKRRTNFAFFDIAIYKDLVVVTELNEGSVHFYNKYSGEDEVQFYNNTDQERYYNVAINSPFTQPFENDKCLEMGCKDICVAGATTSPKCMCREGYRLNGDRRSCSEDLGEFYRALVITNTTHICLLDIRSIMTDPVYHGQVCIYKQTIDPYLQNEIQFVDLDMLNRRVIFATKRTINTINIFSDMEQPHEMLLATIEDITSIAYDWSARKIYWTQGGEDGAIAFYSLQSQTSKLLIKGVSYPRDLLFLPQEGVIIWTSGQADRRQIEKCNVDGSARSVLVAYKASYGAPRTLVADRIGERLYWVYNNTVWSCRHDGSNITMFDRTDMLSPDVMEVYKSYILVARNEEEGSTVWVIDKRPSHPLRNMLSPDFGTAIGIRVLDEMLQTNVAGPCDEQNGGCEHICLVTAFTRRCECEYGYQLNADMMSCYSEPFYDNFVLVGDQTNSRIYQLSLTNNNEIRGLNTGPIRGPTGIAFNHVTNHVVWGEEGTGSVKTSSLNGANIETLLELGPYGSYPERLAIDFNSGNIYFTFAPSSTNGSAGIGVISKTGIFKIILETGEVPQAIAIDPGSGLMFWSDMGPYSRHVKKAAMDGSSVSILLSSVMWPRGLTLDTLLNYVYVMDGFTDELYRCYYTGSCIKIYQKPFEWPVDIDLLGDYLYYTSWNHQRITMLNMNNYTDITEISYSAELGRFYTLYVYSSSASLQSAHRVCRSNFGLGPCSTFCLPRMVHYSCGCENGVELRSDGRTCANMQSTSTTTTTTTTTTTATSTKKQNKRKAGKDDPKIIAGALTGGIVPLLALFVCLWCRYKRNRRIKKHQRTYSNNSHSTASVFFENSSPSVDGSDSKSYIYDEVRRTGNVGEISGYLTMGDYRSNSQSSSSLSTRSKYSGPIRPHQTRDTGTRRPSGTYNSIDPRQVNVTTSSSSLSDIRNTYLVPGSRTPSGKPSSR